MSRPSLSTPAAGTASEQADSQAIGDADSIAAARQAKYVAFLHRHPFATDAYDLGFLPGIREDYSLQTDDLANVETPVLMVDNDFRNPDAERYVARIQKLAQPPWVCVLGDAATPEQARKYIRLARTLVDEFPITEFVIVPKCREAIEIIDGQFVLGYAMGYSDMQAQDFSEVSDWRGRRVHLLGASPPKQFEAIQRLTQPTLAGGPPADIVGLDWNGPQRVAYLGESWSRDGGRPPTTFRFGQQCGEVSVRCGGSGRSEASGRPKHRLKVANPLYAIQTTQFSQPAARPFANAKHSKMRLSLTTRADRRLPTRAIPSVRTSNITPGLSVASPKNRREQISVKEQHSCDEFSLSRLHLRPHPYLRSRQRIPVDPRPRVRSEGTRGLSRQSDRQQHPRPVRRGHALQVSHNGLRWPVVHTAN
jgi:hypothetical protein